LDPEGSVLLFEFFCDPEFFFLLEARSDLERILLIFSPLQGSLVPVNDGVLSSEPREAENNFFFS
jgi:hypothetical protein